MASRSWFPDSLRLAAVLALAGCRTAPVPPPAPVVVPAPAPVAAPAPRPMPDDEIIVAGRRFPTGTRVITWLDRGGYNAYDARPRPAPAAGLRDHDVRLGPPGPGEGAARQKISPELGALQGFIDQLVLHYDNVGLSRLCFEVLQQRGLSAHFLVDVDGTVYQTLDLQERAQHATTANSRSIGIELAQLGAYPPGDTKVLAAWYQPDATGNIRITPPKGVADPHIHTAGFTGRPARPAPVSGVIQGRDLVQYDYTPEQYAALAKLTAALCRVFPLLQCDYPRDAAGRLVRHKLPDEVLARYRGLLGHYHVQDNKTDPGPAFDWDRLVVDAQALLK